MEEKGRELRSAVAVLVWDVTEFWRRKVCATESVGIEWYRQTKAKQRKEIRGCKTDRGLTGARNVLLVVTMSDICVHSLSLIRKETLCSEMSSSGKVKEKSLEGDTVNPSLLHLEGVGAGLQSSNSPSVTASPACQPTSSLLSLSLYSLSAQPVQIVGTVSNWFKGAHF